MSKSNGHINSSDEYLDFPPQLSTKSSPIRQQRLDQSDCRHLLRDFDGYPYEENQTPSDRVMKADHSKFRNVKLLIPNR